MAYQRKFLDNGYLFHPYMALKTFCIIFNITFLDITFCNINLTQKNCSLMEQTLLKTFFHEPRARFNVTILSEQTQIWVCSSHKASEWFRKALNITWVTYYGTFMMLFHRLDKAIMTEPILVHFYHRIEWLYS